MLEAPEKWKCAECKEWVDVDEIIWCTPEGIATTGDAGEPYHVQCAPPEAAGHVTG